MAYTDIFPAVNSFQEINYNVGELIFPINLNWTLTWGQQGIIYNSVFYTFDTLDLVEYNFSGYDNGNLNIISNNIIDPHPPLTLVSSVDGWFMGDEFQFYFIPQINDDTINPPIASVMMIDDINVNGVMKDIEYDLPSGVFGTNLISFSTFFDTPIGTKSDTFIGVQFNPSDDITGEPTYYKSIINFDTETMVSTQAFHLPNSFPEYLAAFFDKGGFDYYATSNDDGLFVIKVTPTNYGDPFDFEVFRLNFDEIPNETLASGYVCNYIANEFGYICFDGEKIYYLTIDFEGTTANIIVSDSHDADGIFLNFTQSLDGNIIPYFTTDNGIFTALSGGNNTTKILTPISLPCANPCIPLLRRK